jgi:hypothetical protein
VRNALLWLLRVYAYVFHLFLSLFLVGAGIVALTGQNSLTLGMLPWQGAALTRAIVILGAVGIVCVALAVTGIARWIFTLWALVVLGMLCRGFFVSTYSFSSASEFRTALWLTIGALVAFLASLSLFGLRRRR